MRHRERPGKKAFYASAGVHVLAVLAAFLAQVSDPDFTDFETIQITLVSPPPVQEAPEPEPVVEEEVVVETPEPPPVQEPDPVVEEEEEPEEAPPEPTPTPTEPEEDPGDPEPSEELSGEDLNIRMEGLVRDFPEYYANIQRQIQRCFEYRGGGRLETSIVFYISRDGSVDGGTIDFYERSGNVNFDYAAMGAVECAGGRFGPLPEEMGRDRLPILFTFRPRG
jgi:outer membrane biosynthesis protein TonB